MVLDENYSCEYISAAHNLYRTVLSETVSDPPPRVQCEIPVQQWDRLRVRYEISQKMMPGYTEEPATIAVDYAHPVCDMNNG